MNVSRPYGVISHPLDSAVLHTLSGTSTSLTGRQVARLTSEGSQQGIGKALNRLVAEGVVEREEAGRSALYRLNRRHLAAPAVELLVNLRRELFDRLRRAFEEWELRPMHASMFGSAARGDGDVNSDIDLFIVRPEDVDTEDSRWRDQLDRLANDVRSWTGNHAGIVEFGAEDVGNLRRRQPPVLKDLDADAVLLAGPSVEQLLGHAV